MWTSLVPLLWTIGSAIVSGIGAKKAANAAKLPDAQQRAQNAAADELSRRLKATGPMWDQLLAQYSQRLPGAGPMAGVASGVYSPYTGQTLATRVREEAMPEAGSGTTQAVQALAQGLSGGPGGNGRIIWGDRRTRGTPTAY
jgi:hypothetical protein